MIKALLARMNGVSLAAMMLSLLIAPLGNDAFAYEGINECEILKGKMRAAPLKETAETASLLLFLGQKSQSA